MWLFRMWACEPEPTTPSPQVDPCEEDPVGVLCTIAGTGALGLNGDDLPAIDTWLFWPTAGAFDIDGRFVLADFNNWRIRRLEPDGIFYTIAGNGLHEYAADGSVARGSPLENPVDVAYSADGTLYLSELHGARVLRVGLDGLIDTYVGSELSPGYPGYSGDGGPAVAAEISEAFGIALAPDGTLYIGDTGNNCVREVSPDGIITSLAGNGKPGFADGVGTDASFNSPRGLSADDAYVYVADAYNHAIRRIDRATRDVVTIAGTGAAGFGGDGGPADLALLTEPVAVERGPDGLLYVADSKNHVVRTIDAEGAIDTLLGQPQTNGFAGDGTAPEDGEILLDLPNDVLFSPEGDLYVIEMFNARVRRIAGYR